MTKWIERANLPKGEGFYWARTRGHKWWNLIVRVYGDMPFFQVDIWQYSEGSLTTHDSIYDIEEFGPQIALDAPTIEGKREDWQ